MLTNDALPSTGWDLIFKCLITSVDLQHDVAELNDILRTNRKVIDELGQERPDLWQDLKTHTQAHRASLSELDHLTQPPPTGVACNYATRR